MPLPSWAVFAIAAWLFLFGSYRIRLGLRERRAQGGESAPRGLFGPKWIMHLAFGVFYIAAGAYMALLAFGYGAPGGLSGGDDVPLPPAPAEHVGVDR